MSTDFRGIRPATNDLMARLVTDLENKFAKFLIKDQVASVDSDNEDIYGDGIDVESVIKYHSLNSQQLFTFDKKFYPTFEPDGDTVKLYLKGRSLGNSLPDKSGFNNDAAIHGDPTLVESDFDPGIHTYGVKSTAIRFNRPTSTLENQEYLQVPDSTDLQVTTLATGFSVFVRFQLSSIDDQNGRSRTIFEKIDDSTPNNATMLQIKNDGRVVFIVKVGGVEYKKETGLALTPPFSVYDIFVTYATSGNAIHIYVNGVDQTLADFAGTVNWQDTLTNHDLFIFQRGQGSDAGYVYGDLFTFKWYKELVVSQTQVTNHYTNKITISNIPYGQCMVTNYWATYGGSITPPGTGLCSFSATSFSVDSFNICGPSSPPAVGLAAFESDAFESDAFEV